VFDEGLMSGVCDVSARLGLCLARRLDVELARPRMCEDDANGGVGSGGGLPLLTNSGDGGGEEGSNGYECERARCCKLDGGVVCARL